MGPRTPTLPRERARRLVRSLLEWYRLHGRRLPWRESDDPYRIWVSEAMLQQTTVQTVVPRYERFLARFPDLASLALAELDEVLAEWSGLGYYRRARNLKAAADLLVAGGGGRLPREARELRELPGFGPYMAASVASIAFDRPEPPVDANVRRVAARLFALEGPGLDARAAARLRPLFESGSPRLLANALMDLGAMVCLPRGPRCAACPWQEVCAGAKEPGRYGVKPPRQKALARVSCALALVADGAVLVEVGRARLLEGFWDLPHEEAETLDAARRALRARLAPPLARALDEAVDELVVRHTIMSRRIARHVLVLRSASLPAGGTTVPLEGPWARPLTATARKCLAALGARRLPL